ncbi:MAG: DUF4375 domain-containing protein [Pirellulales bacterium]
MPVSGSDIRDLIEARWKTLGYNNLLPAERDYILVWWLQAEVSNGALHQYFYNSTGDNVFDTLLALQSLGATNCHRILNEAVAAFGEQGYPIDRNERIKRLDSFSKVDSKLKCNIFTALFLGVFEARGANDR